MSGSRDGKPAGEQAQPSGLSESRSSLPPSANDIAGLALRQPLWTYEVTGLSFGGVVLQRHVRAPSLRDGFLLTLHADARKVADEPRVFTFRLPRGSYHADHAYLEGREAEDWPRAMRALIVDCGLLATPEAVVSGTVPDPWMQILPPDLHGPAQEALARLGRCWSQWLALAPGYASAGRCETCAAEPAPTGRRERRTYRDHRYAWTGYERQPREPCRHVPWGTEALVAVCARHPELVLELAGVLTPAPFVGPAAESQYMDPETLRRVGLERYVVTSWLWGKMLPYWLFDRAEGRAHHFAASSSAWLSRRRRRYYDSRRHAATASTARLEARLRDALAYASHCWGVSAPAEALICREDGVDGGAAGVLSLPLLESDALDDAPMVLTEDPSVQPPPATRVRRPRKATK